MNHGELNDLSRSKDAVKGSRDPRKGRFALVEDDRLRIEIPVACPKLPTQYSADASATTSTIETSLSPMVQRPVNGRSISSHPDPRGTTPTLCL